MGITAVGGNNTCLNALAAAFGRIIVVELIGRPHLYVFHQERLIPLNIDLHTKLMPSPNNFVCKSAVPGQDAQQKQLHAGYTKRQSYHMHQEAYQHGSWRANESPCNPKYGAYLFARPNKAPVNPREPNVYQLRQRFDKRFTGFSHSWSSERRRSRWLLLDEFVQFPNFWRTPHQTEAQWHVHAERRLYPESRERAVYKGLHDVPPSAWVRHWQ